jgi:hypothetical protein
LDEVVHVKKVTINTDDSGKTTTWVRRILIGKMNLYLDFKYRNSSFNSYNTNYYPSSFMQSMHPDKELIKSNFKLETLTYYTYYAGKNNSDTIYDIKVNDLTLIKLGKKRRQLNMYRLFADCTPLANKFSPDVDYDESSAISSITQYNDYFKPFKELIVTNTRDSLTCKIFSTNISWTDFNESTTLYYQLKNSKDTLKLNLDSTLNVFGTSITLNRVKLADSTIYKSLLLQLLINGSMKLYEHNDGATKDYYASILDKPALLIYTIGNGKSKKIKTMEANLQGLFPDNQGLIDYNDPNTDTELDMLKSLIVVYNKRSASATK